MAKKTVRLTLRPDEPWEVDEDEIVNLRNQGLLIEEDPGVPAGEPPAFPAEIPPAQPEGA